MPWAALIALIEPHYPKASKKGGLPPYPLATMLRIHLLQQWYSLSDPAMEEALIEVPSVRCWYQATVAWVNEPNDDMKSEDKQMIDRASEIVAKR